MQDGENRRIGYARVSTDDQNLDLQLDALKRAGCTRIYKEKLSGGTRKRPRLKNALRYVRKGDILVVWRLDRLGRSLKDLVEIINSLNRRGIRLESLTEAIDTSNATGRLIAGMFAVLAEFERNLIRERTLAGLAAARERGKIGGRRPKLSTIQRAQVALSIESGVKVSSLAKSYGVSRGLIYKIKKEHAI